MTAPAGRIHPHYGGMVLPQLALMCYTIALEGGLSLALYYIYSPSHNQETQTWVKTGHSGVSIVCEDQ